MCELLFDSFRENNSSKPRTQLVLVSRNTKPKRRRPCTRFFLTPNDPVMAPMPSIEAVGRS